MMNYGVEEKIKEYVMYAFRNLPEIYKIAVMLGARVEFY